MISLSDIFLVLSFFIFYFALKELISKKNALVFSSLITVALLVLSFWMTWSSMPYVATIKMVFSVALPVFAALSFVFFGARHVNIFKSFQYFNSMAGFLAFFLGLITVLPQAHKLEKFAKNKTQSSLSSRNDANKNEEAETQLREAHNLVKDHHAVNGTCISEEALNNKIHKIISKPFKGSLKCEKNGWKFIYAFYIDSKNIFIINQDGFVLKNSKVYAMKLKGTKHGVKIEWKGK